MERIRHYGAPPFSVAVIHGGPGAPGSMAPVARELSRHIGILEPLQTATSLEGQVHELAAALEQYAHTPVVLIGSSWGAMLSYILTARHPALVQKLILVGSGIFEARYAEKIMETRLARLGDHDRCEVRELINALNNPAPAEKDAILSRLGHLCTQADACDPLTLDTEVLACQYEIHQQVWQDAEQMRRSGCLLELGRQIRCPVLAIHGDYDPHPAEGIHKPLSSVLTDFRFILLRDCGHLPWIERKARDAFYKLLRHEIACGASPIP